MDRVPLRLLTCLFLMLGVVSFGPPPGPDSRSRKSEFSWSAYGGTEKSNRYAPCDQLNRSNFHKLEIPWTWTSPDVEIREDVPALHTWKSESTPVFHDGVLYTSTSMSQVAALDARTGETL